MPWLKLGLRDLILVVGTAAIWWRLHSDPTWDPAWWISIVAGVLLAASGFALHEWGHWLGAVLSGGVVRPAKSIASVFLFAFDVERSTPRQFLWMSYGGYAASVAGLAAVLGIASWHALSGQVALVLTGLGLLVTAALEIPTTIRVHRGRDLPTGFAYVGTPARREAADAAGSHG